MNVDFYTGTLKTVLHVGCGPPNPDKVHQRFRGPGWREVRLDIDPDVKPDIIGSITEMAAVESGTIDAVYSSHNLEHLYAHEVPVALAEFIRVLKVGGEALVTMPDMQAVAQAIANDRLEDVLYVSPAGPIHPIDVVYGFRPPIARGNTYMAHKTGFSAKSLHAKLTAAGFQEVRVERGQNYDLWGLGVKR